jgi:ribonuclease Z
MHLDDFLERAGRFQNELILAGHFSTRYHPHQVRQHVEKALPDLLGGRLHLWI